MCIYFLFLLVIIYFLYTFMFIQRVKVKLLCLLAIGAILSVATLSSAPAFAKGESYSWQPSGAIKATGGAFGGSFATIEKKSGTNDWHVTSNTKLNNQCTIGPNSKMVPLFSVDVSANKITNNKDFESFGSTTNVVPCMQVVGSIDGGTISGKAPGNATTPTTPTSCDTYTVKSENDACNAGQKFASQALSGTGDGTLPNDYCDKTYPVGNQKNENNACRTGVLFGGSSAFASIRTAACKDETGSLKNTCEANFDKALQDCVKSSSGVLDTVKSCLAEKYPSLTDQINAITGSSNTDAKSSCVIPGVGWLVCPVLSFMADIADSAFTFLSDNFLKVDTGTVSTGSATYSAWQVMRTIANIAFVIAFLFIIFSQLTGQGVSNYGIKKMLPRLIISAILVNLSFIICQAAVDLSNVLGFSLKQIFDSIGGGLNVGTYAQGDESGNWLGIVTAVIAGAGIAWALGLSVLVPFLLAAIVALLMIFIILVVRQMLIILLVVIAPLAFVAFLLPNTEQWFTKWRKMFTALLLVFPVIGVLFGAAGLASLILKSVYAEKGDILGQIVAAGVLVIPLFLVPSLLKGSISAIPAIGNKLTGMSNKLTGNTRSKLAGSGMMKNYAAVKAQKRASIANGAYKGINPISKARSRINRGLNSSRAFNATTGGFGADRVLAGQAQQRKDAQEAMAMFGGDDGLVQAWAESGGDLQKAISLGLVDKGSARASQFKLMQNAGHAKKPTSFLAAAQYMAENGKGSASQVGAALNNARNAGASATDISGAEQAAIAGYRKSGRGDAVAALSTATGTKMTREEGWAQVAASSVHRDGIKADKAGFESYLHNGAKNVETGEVIRNGETATIEALRGFGSMEARAQNAAHDSILAAANHHSGQTFSTIEEAKAHYNIK